MFLLLPTFNLHIDRLPSCIPLHEPRFFTSLFWPSCWFAGVRPMSHLSNQDSHNVNVIPHKMERGGNSVWSFLQDHVDYLGSQLNLSHLSQDPQDAATTQSKNGEKNLFAAKLGCSFFDLMEKVSEIENYWNIMFILSFMAFLVASVCLCARVTGIAAKAIGGFIVGMGLVGLSTPAIAGVMMGNALADCAKQNGLDTEFPHAVGPCYKSGKGLFTVGAGLMAMVTGALLVRPSDKAKDSESPEDQVTSGWRTETVDHIQKRSRDLSAQQTDHDGSCLGVPVLRDQRLQDATVQTEANATKRA